MKKIFLLSKTFMELVMKNVRSISLVLVLSASISCFAGEIHDAAARGDLAGVKKAVERNPAAVNSINYLYRTPLHIAAVRGYKDIVEYLIGKGTNVNAEDVKNRKTPLHYAARHGHTEIIKLLLKAGAHIHKGNRNRWQAIHYASYFNQLEAVKLLIEEGAKVNTKTRLNKWTPLHFAGFNQNWDMRDLLIANGADKDARNKEKNEPILHSDTILELISTEPELPAAMDTGRDFSVVLRYKTATDNDVRFTCEPEIEKGNNDDMTWSPYPTVRGKAEGKTRRYFSFSSPAEVYYVRLIMYDQQDKKYLVRKIVPAHIIWKYRYPDVDPNPLFDYRLDVNISKGIPEHDNIYDTLAKNGVKNIKYFYGGGPPLKIKLSTYVPLKAFQTVLRACLKQTKDIAAIEVKNLKWNIMSMYIKSGKYLSSNEHMPIETIYKMASPAITQYEFFKLAGYDYTRKEGTSFRRVDADKLFTELGMKNEIMKAEYLFTPDRKPDALPIYQKLYGKIKDGNYPEAQEYIRERIRAITFFTRFKAGEWISLFKEKTLSDWVNYCGKWNFENDGVLKGVSESNYYGLLMVYKYRTGTRYEIQGEMSTKHHGGIALGYISGCFDRFFGVHITRKKVLLRPGFVANKSIPGQEFHREPVNRFLIQVWDSRITVYVNDECLFSNRYIQDKFWDRGLGRIGIGGPYYKMPGREVVFRNLKVRKLKKQPAGMQRKKDVIQKKKEPEDIF